MPGAASADPRQRYARGWDALGDRVLRGQSFSGRERNCAFLNTHGARFATVSAVSGFDFADDARAIGLTDWDQDGDVDLWLANRTAPRLRLLRNDATNPGRSVVLRLKGTTANRDAIGARIEVRARNGAQVLPPLVRGLRAGEGFLGQNSKDVVVGLGDATAIDGVVVRWPGGVAETFGGIVPGGRYRLVQGRGQPEALPPRARVALAVATEPVPVASSRGRVFLAVPTPAPPLSYTDLDGKAVTTLQAATGAEPPLVLAEKPGRALLVHLFATWCGPCAAEMQVLGLADASLRAAGVDVLALSVDAAAIGDDAPPAAEAKATVAAVRTFLAAKGFAGMAGQADAQAVKIVEETWRAVVKTRQPLPLPSSLLVDKDGLLAAVYQGPVDLAQLRADVAALGLDTAGRRLHAAMGPGRWLGEQPPPPVRELTFTYMRAGLTEATERVLAWAVAHDPKDAVARSNLAIQYVRAGREAEAETQLREAARLDPENGEIRNNFANRLARRGDYVAAVAEYRAAVARLPKNAAILHGLGSALGNLGQVEEAIGHFAEAVRLDPALHQARRDLEQARAILAGRGKR